MDVNGLGAGNGHFSSPVSISVPFLFKVNQSFRSLMDVVVTNMVHGTIADSISK